MKELEKKKETEKINILIVDDHALIREGLSKILSLDPRINVVGEASDGEEAIEHARQKEIDVILMDINMPKINGITATKIIKSEKPEIGIIALTIHDQEEYLFELIKAGISGYVLKDISPDQLIETIIAVAQGESFISPTLTSKVFAEFSRLTERKNAVGNDLTKRELEVLKLMAQGDSNRIIAEKLFISEKTVKNHITRIFQKINVGDRTQAALYAIKNKIVNL